MASSRAMRKSPRNASPMNNVAQNPIKQEAGRLIPMQRDDAGDDWVEPTLRAPAPSFEDHRGLERAGVLEQMAPLGTMPIQRVKLRVKQWEPPLGSLPAKRESGSGDGVATGGGKEDEGAERPRRSDIRKAEENQARKASIRERDGDLEYTPKAPTRPTSSKSAAPQLTNPTLTPNSTTPQGRQHLKTIVEKAVERSKEIGNELVGLAIQEVYNESLNNKDISEALDAVLLQKATEEQQLAFQAQIRIARRKIKERRKESQPREKSESAPATRVSAQKATAIKSPVKRTRRSTSRNAAHANATDYHTPTPSKPRTRTNGVMNGDEDQRPSKKMKRSGSVSSESSLSSTHSMEDIEPEAAESSDFPILRSRSGGPKLHIFSTGGKAGNKRNVAAAAQGANKASAVEDSADVELAAKKRKLTHVFDDYRVEDSSVRSAPSPAPRPERLELRTTAFPKLQTPATSRNNRSEEYDDLASPASSLAGDFLVPPPPGAMRVSRSRGATPNALGRPKSSVRKMARVKMSPNKKKTGAGGTGRESNRLREREKEAGVAVTDSDSGDGDNNDYCESCHLNGELLCCDGCPRSFHLKCLEPPLTSPPEGEWLCKTCEARREPHLRSPRGLFAMLSDDFRRMNPKGFALPEWLRNHFEGMKTGEDGEYEVVSHLKPKQRALGNHDDADKDHLKLRDGKGKFVLCFKCGKSSLGRREIIACDYCTLRWHLDCLDPPLANPPVRDPHSNNRVKNSWMCPAHAPQELEAMGYPGGEGAVHKLRKPRNARTVESQLRRGVKNNGIIEIENDPSDDETGYDNEDNIIYRVTEKSIKLDFIDRVHKMREETAVRQAGAREVARLQAIEESKAAREAKVAFINRTFIEKDTALSLLSFAQVDSSLGVDPDQVQPLINALITQAPDTSIALINAEEQGGGAGKVAINGTADVNDALLTTPPRSDTHDRALTTKQKQSYLLLIDLIQKRLHEAEKVE